MRERRERISNDLVEKLKRAWLHRQDDTTGEWLTTGAQVLAQLATAPLFLRGCSRVGRRVRTVGAPRILNDGSIVIGDDVILYSRWNPVELACGADGHIEIGRGAHINFGTSVHAEQFVRIGERAQIGQYCVLSDTDVPGMPGGAAGQPLSVEIGDGAWLAGRVTVLPGARIGPGSVITAGSVVAGEVPAGVVAGGIPARVLRRVDAAPAELAHRDHPAAPVAPVARPACTARGTLIADFTIDDLARLLADTADGPPLDARVAPFGQVPQALLQGPQPDAADFAVVWTRPQMAVPSFARVLGFEQVPETALLHEVDAYCDLLARGAAGWRQVLVPTWTSPPDRRGLGLIDARATGAARALTAMNLRLMERLATAGNVYVLDAHRWAVAGGRPAQNPRAWFLGKVAFGDGVLAEAARDVKAAIHAVRGEARKLVVVDLDDTLWGGIVGDVGWQNLHLGGHDAAGEAFVEFQRRLKDLSRRGILLAIVSKNEETTALEAIRSHPEMVLREQDFVSWRINWRDKAGNVAELVAELNLGLQSVVFIDDNPVERGRVREALPEVFVPEWPEDKLLYPSALSELRCFDVPTISAEDAGRTQLYASERKRDAMREAVGSIDAWLEGLAIHVRAEPLEPSNIARAAQLLNKTNQMNLTTRRLTEQEFLEWARGSGHRVWTISVSDRFGDAGLTGIVSIAADGRVARIVDYVLSCRVMGRKVEESMVHIAVETARQAGLSTVEAQLVPTKKNKPCLDFWRGAAFDTPAPELFRWDASAAYPLPGCIQLEWRRDLA